MLLFVLLVAGMMSATILDFDAGALIALGAIVALVFGQLFGLFPNAADPFDSD